MPYIEVTPDDLRRLRELAGIFEIKDVVTKVLDDFLEDYTKPEVMASKKEVETFRFSQLPPLSHAKFLSGSFGDVAVNNPSWNHLLELALASTLQRGIGLKELHKKIGLNIREGKFDQDGYRFIERSNVSFQGVSAQYAARYIGKLAEISGLEVEVEFRWRDKDDAHMPGVTGRLTNTP